MNPKNTCRCFICKHQGRERDLLELYRSCFFCGHEFCYPHHSANPKEIPGIKESMYSVKWTDWGGKVHDSPIPAWNLCVICGLSPQRGILDFGTWVELEKRVIKRIEQMKYPL